MRRVALLRAVNVGGAKVIMAELRAMMETAGFSGVQTLLQTGNLVFDAPAGADAETEARIEAALKTSFGIETDVIVRTAKEWDAVIADNPMTAEAKADPSHLVVMPLKTPVDAAALERLRAVIKGRETVEIAGRTLYAFYPDGIGTSKLLITVIERQLDAKTTGRNWNTALKLQALANA
ncbi:MAG: hypothetical protein B7Y99_04925 [Caulobacterales bacterium 32-69-10]|nr:MAG: hypothetical protein B7Y99_04925 [Caulobacterales bacterium 32-69-10]